MDFEIDDQTGQDLNLFPVRRDDPSIFDYYDVTQTKRGKEALLAIFRSPSNDVSFLSKRQSVIQFFVNNEVDIQLEYLDLDFIDHYLSQKVPVLHDNILDAAFNKLVNAISPQGDYYVISRGVGYLRSHVTNMVDIAQRILDHEPPSALGDLMRDIIEITSNATFQKFIRKENKKFSFLQLNQSDRLIRGKGRAAIDEIMRFTYLLDAYSSVAKICKKRALSFATFNDAPGTVKIKGLFHLSLKKPVANNIAVAGGNNLCFVTGPNMAGKSTFLKSVGICVYLAHIGFPVPAESMETSVFNGLFSTINIPDNIEKGYSHYFNEVKRVKDVVLRIRERKKMFVIFDELFKGTNVMDAYDATLMITSAFARMKQCAFFVSTHIVEVGEKLSADDGVSFKYLDSRLDGDTPVYSYKLLDGISAERFGLLIIKKQGIMGIVDEIFRGSE
jgi:DNA mismatch repair protein MutS